jgi:hypothetical protein
MNSPVADAPARRFRALSEVATLAKIQDCDGKCLGACARRVAESDNPQLSAAGNAFARAALHFGNGAWRGD